jgi:mRNA interferase YafQ
MILVWDNSFKRSFKRLIKKNPQLQNKVLNALELLSVDPFNISLRSHRLSGQLEGLWSCYVAYDCRIIFSLIKDEIDNDELIVLIDIGTHDQAY